MKNVAAAEAGEMCVKRRRGRTEGSSDLWPAETDRKRQTDKLRAVRGQRVECKFSVAKL